MGQTTHRFPGRGYFLAIGFLQHKKMKKNPSIVVTEIVKDSFTPIKHKGP